MTTIIKIVFVILTLVIYGCCQAESRIVEKSAISTHCDFNFRVMTNCFYQIAKYKITVKIKTRLIVNDELGLQALLVSLHGHEYSLTISPDTSLLDGDSGYISFEDLNFDTVPDLAITTSFGTPNLYFDYWIYDSAKKVYIRVGNFPKFTLNNVDQTLTAQVKHSAAQYEHTTYSWNGNKLVKTSSK